MQDPKEQVKRNQGDQKKQGRHGKEGFESREIGLAIAMRRRRMNMTQEELAERAEISRQSICNIEQGKQRPSGHTLMRICRALKLSVGVLNEGKAAVEVGQDSRMRDLEARMCGLTEEEQVWLYETVSVLCDGIQYRGERTAQTKKGN